MGWVIGRYKQWKGGKGKEGEARKTEVMVKWR
jgi:hypothetical protein